MKLAAVITEYNPFHKGHQYQLNEIRKRSDADYILVLMSGNFVQRGLLPSWINIQEPLLPYPAEPIWYSSCLPFFPSAVQSTFPLVPSRS